MAHAHVIRDARAGDRGFSRPSAVALAPVAHVVLRAGTGLLFMQHGLQKLFGMFGGFGGTPGAHAPIASMMGLAGALEVGGGLLLVLGFLTRPVALILMVEMVYAYASVHLPHGGWPIQNGGELALLYAFIFAFLATHGPGPYAVDTSIRRG